MTTCPWRLLFGIAVVVIVILLRTIIQDDCELTRLADPKYTERKSKEAGSLSSLLLQNNNNNPTLPPAWFWEESKILVATPGSHVVSNICMHSSPNSSVRLFMVQGNNVTVPLIKAYRQLSEFQIYSNASDLINHINITTFIEEETVYLADGQAEINTNPGHCMNDMIFSLAMDIANRKKHQLLGGSSSSNSTDPLYPRFVYGGINPGECREFCCDFLSHKLEFIRYPEGSVSAVQGINGGDDDAHRSPSAVCFAKLVMPRISVLRHAFHPRNKAETEALKMIQSHMFHNTTVMSKQLDSSPWPTGVVVASSANATTATPQSTIPILLYGRESSVRRVLVNTTGFKTLLQDDYGVQHVDYIDGPHWASIVGNQTAQARLFNSHRHILTVHGAHLANLFYARPGTKVFEIQCWMPPRTSRSILQQWFLRWAPILGITYHVYIETVGCQTDGQYHKLYSPPHVFISDMAKFRKELSDFFGLERRVAGSNNTL